MIRRWRAESTDAAERGRAYGRAWRAELRVSLAEYSELFDRLAFAPDAVSRVVDGALAQTAEHAPGVLDELVGVADGAEMTIAEIMTLNARTEVLALQKPEGGECSTAVFLPADGPPRTIQTWDWLDALSADNLVRSHIASDGRRVVTFAEFGQAAKIGVNSRGLGAHFNILHHASDGAGAGLPVHILARRILDEASTVDEAVAIAEAVPLSASTVITLVTRDRAVCVELAPSGIAVIDAVPGQLLAHTNHFIDDGLSAGEVTVYASTTAERLACLTDHADKIAVPTGLERALALGAVPDAPISMRPRPESPRHLQWASKATITIDVAEPAIELHEGGPAEVTSEGWRRIEA
ncbi:C45 family autoproteolytic acyltransferase/hydolase [Microbacterium halotolerans]|uniref:C45 family autoproteolytic acyltransferase/hydolase n=1 Tax=Microbacterium halotolerans TaxID=246613 RepID=UPI000E6AC35C|nr:C45 family peptidase [Microbacterium halotolerans]